VKVQFWKASARVKRTLQNNGKWGSEKFREKYLVWERGPRHFGSGEGYFEKGTARASVEVRDTGGEKKAGSIDEKLETPKEKEDQRNTGKSVAVRGEVLGRSL